MEFTESSFYDAFESGIMPPGSHMGLSLRYKIRNYHKTRPSAHNSPGVVY